jgi:hypothetical protein
MHVRSASTAARYANLTSLTNLTYRRSYRWRIWMALMSHAQMHVQCERGIPEQLIMKQPWLRVNAGGHSVQHGTLIACMVDQ